MPTRRRRRSPAGPRTHLLTLLVACWALVPAFAAAAQTAADLSGPERFAAARERLAVGDPAAAVELLEPLGGDPATPPPVVALLATLYVETGRSEAALTLLEPRLAGTAPGDAELHFVAARASQALGRNDDAERHLAAAAELAPTSRAAVLLAAMRSEAGRHAEAAALLAPIAEGEALDLLAGHDPRFAAEIAVHYGRTLLALGRPADAVAYLRRGAEASTDDAALWRLLGETLIELERVDEARQAIARAHQLDEAEHRREVERQALRERAREKVEAADAERAADRPEEAVKVLREAIALVPEDPLPRMLAVRLLSELGRHGEALAEVAEVVRLMPGNPEALQLSGMTRLAAGDAAGAEGDLRQALAADPDHQGALGGLALALIARGRLSEAEQVVGELLALAPDDPLGLRALERIRALR